MAQRIDVQAELDRIRAQIPAGRERACALRPAGAALHAGRGCKQRP